MVPHTCHTAAKAGFVVGAVELGRAEDASSDEDEDVPFAYNTRRMLCKRPAPGAQPRAAATLDENDDHDDGALIESEDDGFPYEFSPSCASATAGERPQLPRTGPPADTNTKVLNLQLYQDQTQEALQVPGEPRGEGDDAHVDDQSQYYPLGGVIQIPIPAPLTTAAAPAASATTAVLPSSRRSGPGALASGAATKEEEQKQAQHSTSSTSTRNKKDKELPPRGRGGKWISSGAKKSSSCSSSPGDVFLDPASADKDVEKEQNDDAAAGADTKRRRRNFQSFYYAPLSAVKLDDEKAAKAVREFQAVAALPQKLTKRQQALALREQARAVTVAHEVFIQGQSLLTGAVAGAVDGDKSQEPGSRRGRGGRGRPPRLADATLLRGASQHHPRQRRLPPRAEPSASPASTPSPSSSSSPSACTGMGQAQEHETNDNEASASSSTSATLSKLGAEQPEVEVLDETRNTKSRQLVEAAAAGASPSLSSACSVVSSGSARRFCCVDDGSACSSSSAGAEADHEYECRDFSPRSRSQQVVDPEDVDGLGHVHNTRAAAPAPARRTSCRSSRSRSSSSGPAASSNKRRCRRESASSQIDRPEREEQAQGQANANAAAEDDRACLRGAVEATCMERLRVRLGTLSAGQLVAFANALWLCAAEDEVEEISGTIGSGSATGKCELARRFADAAGVTPDLQARVIFPRWEQNQKKAGWEQQEEAEVADVRLAEQSGTTAPGSTAFGGNKEVQRGSSKVPEARGSTAADEQVERRSMLTSCKTSMRELQAALRDGIREMTAVGSFCGARGTNDSFPRAAKDLASSNEHLRDEHSIDHAPKLKQEQAQSHSFEKLPLFQKCRVLQLRSHPDMLSRAFSNEQEHDELELRAIADLRAELGNCTEEARRRFQKTTKSARTFGAEDNLAQPIEPAASGRFEGLRKIRWELRQVGPPTSSNSSSARAAYNDSHLRESYSRLALRFRWEEPPACVTKVVMTLLINEGGREIAIPQEPVWNATRMEYDKLTSMQVNFADLCEDVLAELMAAQRVQAFFDCLDCRGDKLGKTKKLENVVLQLRT